MNLHLEKDDYQEQLITEQARLSGLMRDKRMRRHALVAVFEGNDAAGGFRGQISVVPLPDVQMEWDEATCGQLVWLYNEVINNYAGLAVLELVQRIGFHLAQPPQQQQEYHRRR